MNPEYSHPAPRIFDVRHAESAACIGNGGQPLYPELPKSKQSFSSYATPTYRGNYSRDASLLDL